MQVGVWRLQNLLYPVHQFDVRIAAQLAEHRCALDRLVCEAVQLAKQRRAADFTHAARAPSRSTTASPSRHRSSALVSARRRPSQVVNPRRPPPPSVSSGTSSCFSSKRTSQSSSKQRYILTQ